jgi:hypothetical protein
MIEANGWVVAKHVCRARHAVPLRNAFSWFVYLAFGECIFFVSFRSDALHGNLSALLLTAHALGDNIPGLITRISARRLVGMNSKLNSGAAAILPILALAALGSLAAPAASAQTTAFQCMATSGAPGAPGTPGGSQFTIYVSQLLPMETKERATLTGAWTIFVKANYHLDAVTSSVCQPLGTDSAMQQRIVVAELNAWQKKGLNVVQVKWIPGQAPKPADSAPAAAAPPPAPSAPEPAANQGPQPRASYCYSDEKKPTVYFSDAFDTADLPSSSAWSAAFAKFLTQKYAYKGTVTCKDKDTIFNVQGMIRDQKDALQGKQTVDTDWTYEPPAPGDSAPANATAPAAAPPPAPAKTHASH